MRTQLLDPNVHDRASFDCGHAAPNRFLYHTARQHHDKDNARTYVLADKNGKIAGFYTLSLLHVTFASLPPILQKKHRSNTTAGLIARLAVDKRHQGRGIGGKLLVDALLKLLRASEIVGFGIVVVDAKSGASGFYEAFGFHAFDADPTRLYLSIADIRASFARK